MGMQRSDGESIDARGHRYFGKPVGQCAAVPEHLKIDCRIALTQRPLGLNPYAFRGQMPEFPGI